MARSTRGLWQRFFLLGAFASVGCAHAPSQSADEGTTAARPVERIVVTGSRIPQAVSMRNGLPATVSPVVVWTREDLARTGTNDIAKALRDLDPSITTKP